MARITTTALVAVALAATAGCSKNRPEELPPAPVGAAQPDYGTQAPQQPGTGYGQTGSEATPGSRADFLRSVQSDTVYFATDSYDIDPQARGVLDAQARWLGQYPNVRVTVEGHADERGTREYNLALGDRRANAAKNYLAAQGVSPGRITTISYGKERPVATGSDESAWAQNRRAVTVVLQ